MEGARTNATCRCSQLSLRRRQGHLEVWSEQLDWRSKQESILT
jgi:hypothetical protein